MKRLARWPAYRERAPRVRQLALLTAEFLELPHDTYAVRSYAELKELAFRLDPLPEMYTTNLLELPYFGEIIADPHAKVLIPSTAPTHNWNMITSIVIKGKGNRSVWLLSSRAWNTPTATPEFLATLQRLFALCEVGTRPTPGSLGQAVLRQHWQAEHRSSLARPTNPCRQTLLDTTIGGRVDYFVSPKNRFAKVFEQDVTGAHASVCDLLPAGLCVRLFGEPLSAGGPCVTWYMCCRVVIPDDSAVQFGIFGERARGQENHFPTQPGEYQAWLWKEEVDLCRRNGWLVQCYSGWGWTSWSSGLASWAQRMYRLRSIVREHDSALGSMLKQATVACLGRFGMPLWSWTLLPETKARRGDISLLDGWTETGWVLRRINDWESNALSHWFSYILMRTRLVLRARMQWEHERGNTVLASNYDALYCLLPADPTTLGAELGQWKETVLTYVSFPFPRGIISREKTTLPGVKR